ncbi:hypothetical protein Tco_0453197 [Tanacetum coccineum]
MADLAFVKQHNMVAYLEKTEENADFHQILDFLTSSSINFALTVSPTIYASYIEQFWNTAFQNLLHGISFLQVDGKAFTITEASVRRHLQLADADGLKEGEGSGNPSEPQPPPSTAQPTHEEQIPVIESSSHQKTQTPRQALQEVTELPQTSEPIPNVLDEDVYQEWDDIVERATTTAASLDAEQASGGSLRCQEAIGGSIAQTRSERVPTPPHDSPLPRGHTPRSDEGSMTLHELTVLCTQLSNKVKKLEQTVKTSQARRRAKIVISNDEEVSGDSSKQGMMIEDIDQDARITLVTPTKVSSQEDQPEDQLRVLSAAKVIADAARVYTYTRRRRAVTTGSGRVSTDSRIIITDEESVSTVGASTPVSTAGMVQESTPSPRATKDKAERQKIDQVHQAAQGFIEDEWENIRARVEADEELTQKLQAKERDKYSKVYQAKMLVDLMKELLNSWFYAGL